MKYLITFLTTLICLSSFSQKQFGVDQSRHVPEGIAIKDEAPQIFGITTEREKYQSRFALREGSLIAYFLQGTWSEEGRATLTELQENLPAIQEKNASVVVVCGDDPKKLIELKKELNLDYTIIHDSGMATMKGFDVLYNVTPQHQKIMQRDQGAELTKSGTSNVLPVAAMYIIAPNNYVLWSHFDFDPESRPDLETVIQNLPPPMKKE